MQEARVSRNHPTMEELFARHAPKLFAYLRLHAPSREDAEDILAETFMAALADQKFPHLSDTAQVAWLWRVARNKAADAYRKAAFRHNVSLEQVSETMYEDEAREPEQIALRQADADEIHDLVHALPETQREILQLRFGYGLHCGEIAAVLGKRENTVRTMLSRTMNSLRHLYAERPFTAQARTPDQGDKQLDKR